MWKTSEVGKRRRKSRVRSLRLRRLLHKLKVTVLVVGGPRRFLYELEELLQAIAFGGLHGAGTYANSGGGPAARHHAAERAVFDQDFSVWNPERDINFRAGFYGGCGFDQASAHAGVRKIAPDRRAGFVYAQLNGYEALDPLMTASVAAEIVAAVQVRQHAAGLERRRRRCGGWNCFGRRRHFLLFHRCAGCVSLDFAHRHQQSSLPLFGRSLAVGLEQFAHMPNQVGIRKYSSPVGASSRTHGMRWFPFFALRIFSFMTLCLPLC